METKLAAKLQTELETEPATDAARERVLMPAPSPAKPPPRPGKGANVDLMLGCALGVAATALCMTLLSWKSPAARLIAAGAEMAGETPKPQTLSFLRKVTFQPAKSAGSPLPYWDDGLEPAREWTRPMEPLSSIENPPEPEAEAAPDAHPGPRRRLRLIASLTNAANASSEEAGFQRVSFGPSQRWKGRPGEGPTHASAKAAPSPALRTASAAPQAAKPCPECTMGMTGTNGIPEWLREPKRKAPKMVDLVGPCDGGFVYKVTNKLGRMMKGVAGGSQSWDVTLRPGETGFIRSTGAINGATLRY
ncbi:MAG: hypothetical protein HY059_09885 [Proteobacteria bacterium]|nr:hypothetical protein [Pseudomonadota bacterium]